MNIIIPAQNYKFTFIKCYIIITIIVFIYFFSKIPFTHFFIQWAHFFKVCNLLGIPEQTVHPIPEQTVHLIPEQTVHPIPEQTVHPIPEQTEQFFIR